MTDYLRLIQRMYDRAQDDSEKCDEFEDLLRTYVENQYADTSLVSVEGLLRIKAQVELRLADTTLRDTPYGEMIRLPESQRRLVFGAFILHPSTQEKRRAWFDFEQHSYAAQAAAFNAHSLAYWEELSKEVCYVTYGRTLVDATLSALVQQQSDPVVASMFELLRVSAYTLTDRFLVTENLILPELRQKRADFKTVSYEYIRPDVLPLIRKYLDCTREDTGLLRFNPK